MNASMLKATLLGSVLLAAPGCGDSSDPKSPDATVAPAEVTTDHCDYQALTPTAGAGQTVTQAPLFAGASEAILDIPVGTALGAFTARAGFLGSSNNVDLRRGVISGQFNASVGVQNAPKVKAISLRAGDDQTVLVKLDLGLMYEALVFDVEAKLGAEFAGKVIITASHSHSAWGQQTGSFIFQVGLGDFRNLVYQRYVDTITRVVQEAVAAQRPAKLGIVADFAFDLQDDISRDRRPENDELMGGSSKDSSMFMIRVDGVDNAPIAALPVYGVHGTIMGSDNSFATSDSIGGAERWLEEQFDSKVVVMHLQGAGGDVSPHSYGNLDCDNEPGNEGDPCFDWLAIEGHGRTAAPALLAAYQAAGDAMETDIALEMMTRSIETGPFPDTFTIRDGSLRYAAFEPEREADREIFDNTGAIISPIDEFNAPVGAALCLTEKDQPDTAYPLFPAGLIPGTDMLIPYGACVRVSAATEILSQLMKIDKGAVDETHPVCQTTRTTISALRLGDYVLGTMPGELTVMLADQIREKSPVAPEKTIVLGYAQGHTGYALTPEDWLQGGYETSINVWGPLEAEYIGEQLATLMTMSTTAEREDGAAGGTTRVATSVVTDTYPIDTTAPMAGTIPAQVPDRVWLRTGPAAQAQPAAQVPRVSGHATFVWIGDDPSTKTPVVTLQHEVGGSFTDVQRRSGRTIRTEELLLMYTPLPLRREEGQAQTHYWAVEWQAVPWTGAQEAGQDLDGMEARAGLPLGRYRFHVEGQNYSLDSNAFEVTPAALTVAASQAAATLSGTLTLHAPKGYRLLDMNSPSNQPVPVQGGQVSVTLTLDSGPPVPLNDVQIAADGSFSVPVPKGRAVTNVQITDRFGNQGSIAL